MQAYPKLDVDCLKSIGRIIRERSLGEEMPLFVKCIYETAGAGLNLLVGEPEGIPQSAEMLEAIPDDVLSSTQTALRGLVEDGLPQASTNGEPAEALGPVATSLLIELALKAIAAAIERRKNAD